MPAFPNLVLSGGEPTLRDDAADIVDIFVRHAGASAVDIPTNGLLPERALALADRLLGEHPALRVTIGLSLDGLADTHDALRGVPGAFGRVFETARALGAARAGRPDWQRRLALVGITCLSARNEAEYPQLLDYARASADFDLLDFEAIRPAGRDATLTPPPAARLRELAALTAGVNFELLGRRMAEERATRLSYIAELHDIQAAHAETGRIPMICMAGRRVAVIEHDGRLRLCELLDPVADLRGHNLDFARAWNCPAARAQRRWIRRTRCACGHCVMIGHSIDDHAPTSRRRQARERRLREA